MVRGHRCCVTGMEPGLWGIFTCDVRWSRLCGYEVNGGTIVDYTIALEVVSEDVTGRTKHPMIGLGQRCGKKREGASS